MKYLFFGVSVVVVIVVFGFFCLELLQDVI